MGSEGKLAGRANVVMASLHRRLEPGRGLEVGI